MIYRLKRAFVWLRRFTHLRGNGVQSPFVYDFIWQVIDNRSAYYAYTDLHRELKALPLRQRKLAKLLFRLANYVQPCIIRLDKDLHNTYAPFLERGCAKAAITTTDDTVPTLSSQSSAPLLIVSQKPCIPPDPSLLSVGSMIVALNIRKPNDNKNLWRQLLTSPWATLTFDLYNYGIVIIAPDRYKQHYVINF